MSAPTKLTLHIGTAKAGSTSIQANLQTLKDPSFGALPIRTFGSPNAKFLAMACHNPKAHFYFVTKHKALSDAEFKENSHSIWDKTKAEIDASDVRHFVASSEFLGGLVRDDSIVNLKTQLDQLFDQIQIVVYLRDQRSFLRSFWAQSVKGSSKLTDSFPAFLAGLDIREYHWNYSIFLKKWLQAFGLENMSVSIFDPQVLRGGDVVSDFYQKAGIMSPISQKQHSNVSPSWRALEEMRHENIAQQGLTVETDTNETDQLLDATQYENLVLGKVSEGNIWINKTFFEGHDVQLPASKDA